MPPPPPDGPGATTSTTWWATLGAGLALPVHEVRPGAGAAPPDGAAPSPVLLLHGFPASWRSWDAVAAPLAAAGHRCLAPQQRGYTASARPAETGAYRLERLAADAAAVLDAADVERAVVVGHDWGAVVAWALAAAHPERVEHLVALSVPHPRAFAAGLREDREQRRRSAYIGLLRRRGVAERVLLAGGARGLRAAYAGSAVPRPLVDAHLAPLASPGALAGALAWYRGLRGRDLASVGPVDVPTTYLWSDRDVAVARGTAARCAEHVTGPFRVRTLEGVSHWVPEERPDDVVDAVRQPPA
ncbi:alpha/beta fold hydrolase [uncultured Pseudokineococcus sp.]|uniref:alpha/beta fold hydrolase n=1 Tax=uncultured Pseudokineococcus sp. TaxID=1642928 RepID=UPI00262BF124|nr:alpha/beta hydrolase [uncultured Pseudokineococcus sp.]